jgi:hypothetical protein
MAATYEPIQSQTLSSTATSINFNSIPQTYTDLILVTNNLYSSGSGYGYLQFNSNSSGYSRTEMFGTGTNPAQTARFSNLIPFTLGDFGCLCTVYIQNYTDSTRYKPVFYRAGNGDGLTLASGGLWQNNNAINSIQIIAYTTAVWAANSTFTLYGIKAA